MRLRELLRRKGTRHGVSNQRVKDLLAHCRREGITPRQFLDRQEAEAAHRARTAAQALQERSPDTDAGTLSPQPSSIPSSGERS